MDVNQALALVRQACEAHGTNWQQHQLMQQALNVVESACAMAELAQPPDAQPQDADGRVPPP